MRIDVTSSVAVTQTLQSTSTAFASVPPYATGSAGAVSGVAQGTTAYTAPSSSQTGAIVTAGAPKVGAGLGVAAIAGMAALAVF